MRRLSLIAALLFAACSGGESDGQVTAAGAPVEQGAADTEYQPAFAAQTRAPEQISNVTIASEVIASGLDHPWAIAFLPDGRLLVTERAGRLRVITRDGAVSEPLTGLPVVDARGQGGLLDVVVGPTFATDRLIIGAIQNRAAMGPTAQALRALD